MWKRLEQEWEAEITARGGKPYGKYFASIVFVVIAITQIIKVKKSGGVEAMLEALDALLVVVGIGLLFTIMMIFYRVGQNSRKREIALSTARDGKSQLEAHRELAESMLLVMAWNHDDTRGFIVTPKRNFKTITVYIPSQTPLAKNYQITRKADATRSFGIDRDEWTLELDSRECGEWISYVYNEDTLTDRLYDKHHELEFTSNAWEIPESLRIVVESGGHEFIYTFDDSTCDYQIV